MIALTGGGGRHLYFQHPGIAVRNAVGTLGPGLDVRGDGGLIVAPPSRHQSGRGYAWEVTAHPDEVALAPAPLWLLARLRERAGDRLRADGTPLVLREGERNDQLFRLACGQRRLGLGEHALLEYLDSVSRHHCQPPLVADELARIAASACRYPPARSDDGVLEPACNAPPGEEIPWPDDKDVPPLRESGVGEPAPGDRDGLDPVAGGAQRSGDEGDHAERPLFVRACELSAPPITWCVEGLVADRMLHVLSGKDKRGKTLLALEIGRAVLRGHPLVGHFSTRPGPVMAALLDDPLALTLERLDRLGVRGAVDDFYVVDPMRMTDLTAVLGHLAHEAPALQPALVILDALYLFLPDGREAGNDAARMKPLMMRLNRLVDETGAAVLVVAHDNKSGSDVAGSYVIRAMAKAILRLAVPAEPSDETGPDEPTTTRRVLTLESKLVAAGSHMLDLRGVGDWLLLGDPKTVRADDLSTAVLRRLREGLTGTVEEIARTVGKRREAVGTVLADLVRTGLVHETHQRTGRRGPLARVYAAEKLCPEPGSRDNGRDGIPGTQGPEESALFDQRGNSVSPSGPRAGRRDGVSQDDPDREPGRG